MKTVSRMSRDVLCRLEDELETNLWRPTSDRRHKFGLYSSLERGGRAGLVQIFNSPSLSVASRRPDFIGWRIRHTHRKRTSGSLCSKNYLPAYRSGVGGSCLQPLILRIASHTIQYTTNTSNVGEGIAFVNPQEYFSIRPTLELNISHSRKNFKGRINK